MNVYKSLTRRLEELVPMADGTVRLYCSHNFFGNIMYADSKDGGNTFGPIQKLEGALHCDHSSMQFVRDPYGPTDTSYFMVYLPREDGMTSTRSRLSLAYSTDGKNWKFIGDIWRYEYRYSKAAEDLTVAQVVDPFVRVTEDYIICGSGISEYSADTYHNAQRQHIWAIRRDTLPEGTEIK